MQGNDLDSAVVPRLLLVWEGLIAYPPNNLSVNIRVFNGLNKPRRIVSRYTPHELVCHRIWDLIWRLNFQIDVVTWLGDEYVNPIHQWIDKHDLPLPRVTSEDPQNFSRKIAYMPYVAAIYDPDPAHQFLFGSKGRIVNMSNPTNVATIGSW